MKNDDDARAAGMRRFEELQSEEDRRNAWPESCPLSEEELRTELEREVGEIQAIIRRMEALYAKLPEPEDEDAIVFHDIPETVYSTLRDVLGELYEFMLSDAVKEIERALGETPESLQKEWLKSPSNWQGRTDGGFIIPG